MPDPTVFIAHRAKRYAFFGVCLGLLCPIGWVFLRFLLFGGGSFLASVTDGNYHAGEQLGLTLYMGIGTAIVFGAFGHYLGKTSQAMQQRVEDLAELNRTIEVQKREFEGRYRLLNQTIKNFHVGNARIQSSLDRDEVMALAAEALHEVLKYDRVNILTLDPAQRSLVLVSARGGAAEGSAAVVLPLDERSGVIARAVRENHPVLVADIAASPPGDRLSPPFDEIERFRSRSFVLAPISIDGAAVGVIAVDNKISGRPLDETDIDTVRLFADQLAAAINRIRLVQGVESLIGELHRTFGEIAAHRGRLAALIRSLKDGSEATAGTIAQIADSVAHVGAVVDDTGSATTEISTAIDEVGHNFEQLQQFMVQSSATITEIAATARHVEENAASAYEMSETVHGHAESGVAAVRDTFGGLVAISAAVDETGRVIEGLSHKGREIDRIIDVINEINQKTNLLSLNAAIIAAQAGDHGRSFSVVADEIRSLSKETEQSAEAIAGLVREIQGLTGEAVRQVATTRTMVDRDIVLGRSTEQALQLIQESAAAAMRMASEIRQSTGEQVIGSQSMARSIVELEGMANHLLHASREQTQGIHRIVRSIADIRSMAGGVAAAVDRQDAATRRIDVEVEQVGEMAEQIFDALVSRQNESYRVIEQLEAVKRGSRD